MRHNNDGFCYWVTKTTYQKDIVWVIVDHFTKSAHFMAIKKTDGVERLEKIYMDEIMKLEGVSFSIVSDRDSRFTPLFSSNFSIKRWVREFTLVSFITL